jgi:hypothetical protein
VIRARTALILSVPALRARSSEQRESLVSHLSTVLAERAGERRDGLDVEVTASVCAAVVSTAVERWARDGGDLPSIIEAAFAAVSFLASRSAFR